MSDKKKRKLHTFLDGIKLKMNSVKFEDVTSVRVKKFYNTNPKSKIVSSV